LRYKISEAIAAKSAGINALLLVREGNQPLTHEDIKQFQTVSSFADIEFE